MHKQITKLIDNDTAHEIIQIEFLYNNAMAYNNKT